MNPIQYASREEKIARLKELERLEQLRRVKVLRQARRDVNAFIEYAFSDTRRKTSVKQSQIHLDVQTAIDQNEYVFVELPRDSGKTTQCVARSIFWLGNNPDELIKVVSVSDGEAKKRIREISEHIRFNPKVLEVFPHLKPGNMKGWTQHAIYVQRSIVSKDASVEAYGLESSAIGGRATRLIFDDVVNPKSVRSEALRKSTTETFYGVWLPMVDEDDDRETEPEPDISQGLPASFEELPDDAPERVPRGGQLGKDEKPTPIVTGGAKVVWIGTPWHKADLHCELKNKAKAMGWFCFSRPVGGEWAREQARRRGEPDDEFAPIWPELWGRSRLLKRFKRLPRIHFARAYWLQPMSDEDKVWNTADYRFCTWDDVQDVEIFCTGGAWDFQFSEKRSSDYNAYTAAGIGPDLADERRLAFYIFRSSHFRGGLQTTARCLKDWAVRDGLDHLGLEEVQAQTWMRQYVSETATLPIRRLNPQRMGGDKYMRALRTQPYFEQHRVYFLPGTEDLQAEMDDFPFGGHDDMVDTIVYVILMLFELYLCQYENQDLDADDDGSNPNVYDDGVIRINAIGGTSKSESAPSLDDDEVYEPLPSLIDRVRFL